MSSWPAASSTLHNAASVFSPDLFLLAGYFMFSFDDPETKQLNYG
jgi:hypothetical protein